MASECNMLKYTGTRGLIAASAVVLCAFNDILEIKALRPGDIVDLFHGAPRASCTRVIGPGFTLGLSSARLNGLLFLLHAASAHGLSSCAVLMEAPSPPLSLIVVDLANRFTRVNCVKGGSSSGINLRGFKCLEQLMVQRGLAGV